MDNVDPFIKVLHVPTMAKVIREIKNSYESLGPSMQALVLAISLAAIMSLDEEEVWPLTPDEDVSLTDHRTEGQIKFS